MVVDHNFITDEEDSTLLWLELSVHDMRAEGKGLVGLRQFCVIMRHSDFAITPWPIRTA